MTHACLYNFKEHTGDFRDAQRLIPLVNIEGAVRSSSSAQLVLQIEGTHDYLLEFEAANRVGFFVQVLQAQFARACKRALLVHTVDAEDIAWWCCHEQAVPKKLALAKMSSVAEHALKVCV